MAPKRDATIHNMLPKSHHAAGLCKTKPNHTCSLSAKQLNTWSIMTIAWLPFSMPAPTRAIYIVLAIMAISSDSPDKVTGLFKFGFSTNKNVNQKAETSMLKRNSIEGTATALEHQQPYTYLPMWTSRSRALLVRIVQAPDVWQLLFYFGNLIFTLLARHGKLILKLNVNPWHSQ